MIKCAVLIVHECNASCTFDFGRSCRSIKKEETGEEALNIINDWTNMLHVQCMLCKLNQTVTTPNSARCKTSGSRSGGVTSDSYLYYQLI